MRIPRTTSRGPRLAGWTPGGSRPEYAVVAEPDTPIPVDDGTVLIGDVHRPRTDEPQPALLGWSPYDKDLMPTGAPAPFNEPGDVTRLAARGYPVAVVNARGTRRSGGALPPLMFDESEVADLRTVIGWIARQPWCDGRVAMIGMSYFAVSQLVAAGHRLVLELGSDPHRLAPPAGDYVYFAMADPAYAARNTVHGAELELTVRGEPPW